MLLLPPVRAFARKGCIAGAADLGDTHPFRKGARNGWGTPCCGDTCKSRSFVAFRPADSDLSAGAGFAPQDDNSLDVMWDVGLVEGLGWWGLIFVEGLGLCCGCGGGLAGLG